jgi:uncharacterized LabA/DUF88 family protein/cold shock CspA family protein
MKAGIFVDAANISVNGGYSMRYDVLKEYCLRNNTQLIRLNTYLAYDSERAENDYEYRDRQVAYHSVLRSFGFKVITKTIKRFVTEEGEFVSKANADIDMAVDMLLQSNNLDKIYLLTGDSDFQKVVQAVQNKGARVEQIAFKNIAKELTHEVDFFTSGYIIPNLIPIKDQESEQWGKEGCRVRGTCYALQDGFGFMRYLDFDHENHEIFFHFSQLPRGIRPRLEEVFEFTLAKNLRGDGLMATDIIAI